MLYIYTFKESNQMLILLLLSIHFIFIPRNIKGKIMYVTDQQIEIIVILTDRFDINIHIIMFRLPIAIG